MPDALSPGMKKIITAAVALMLFGGVASADRWHGHRDGGRDTSHRPGGTEVRNRNYRDNRVVVRDNRSYYRDNRGYRDNRRVVVNRRPVYVNNGHYRFGNGINRVYHRPVIRHRYYDYRVRPQIIVENYDPVPGYVWVSGNWNWNGYEWQWTSGYFAVDTNYNEGYYDGY